MTPAQKVGLKVGNSIRMLNNEHFHFNEGDVTVFKNDDGSNIPIFKGKGSKYPGGVCVGLFSDEWEKVEMNTKFKAMTFMCGDDSELFGRVVSMLDELGYHPDANISPSNYVGTIAAGSNGKYSWQSRTNETVDGHENINIDWLRTASPETIELNGKTYVKSELEEAIAKIKPVEGV